MRALRGRRGRILASLLVLGSALAFLRIASLGREASTPPSTSPGAPGDLPYFLAHQELLREPSEELRRAVSFDLASWETPTPLGPTSDPRWFVLVGNVHDERRVTVADVIVLPTPATAPGVGLRRSSFASLDLEPGEQREVEIVTEIVADPDRTPRPSPEPADYGVRLYVVAAFAEDTGPSSGSPPTPASKSAFRETWGAFSLLDGFTEIPPNLLSLRPPDE